MNLGPDPFYDGRGGGGGGGGGGSFYRPLPTDYSYSSLFLSKPTYGGKSSTIYSNFRGQTTYEDPSHSSTKYDLPCELEPIGCKVRFPSDELEDWVAHSVSHFDGNPPITRASCKFCGQVWYTYYDTQRIWRERMAHLKSHHAAGDIAPKDYTIDPDIASYMEKRGLLSVNENPSKVQEAGLDIAVFGKADQISDNCESLNAIGGLTSSANHNSLASTTHESKELEIEREERQQQDFQTPSRSQLTDSVDDKIVPGGYTTLQDSVSSDNTCPEDETDWEQYSDIGEFDHEMSNSLQIPACNETSVSPSLVQAIMDRVKVELVNRLMNDFWVIFNQDWATGIRQCSSGSNSGSNFVSVASLSPSFNENGSKHSRERMDSQPPVEDKDSRASKRPRTMISPSRNMNEKPKFACPYRKHNPRKYNVRNWSPCALTPHKTVARVKFVFQFDHDITD